MKTPPLQQKQAAGPQQESSTQESEGKSLAPPAFQLKASESGGAPSGNPTQLKAAGPQGGGGQGAIQMAGQFYTINNTLAALRGGAPDFKSLGKTIPKFTSVEILEEVTNDKGIYVRVKNADTGAELGWTKKENVTGIQDFYKPAKASYTYHIGGYDMLVFVPKGIEKASNPNVFLFFHGNGGDYSLDKKHTPGTYEFPDNPALSANMNDAVANSGSIAICPQGHHEKMSTEWGNISADAFKSMVDQTLTQLSGDLGRGDKPLKAGTVSIAGHSAGGAALGKAALGTGASDVTLQDAGYGFTNSWKSLREWFFGGKEPKTVRVITRPNADDTHTLIDAGGYFDKSQITSYASKLGQKVTVEEFKGDGKTVEEGGIKLVSGYRVYRKDGSLIGSLRYYQRTSGDHWAASSGTMEASMTSGKKDKESDAKKK